MANFSFTLENWKHRLTELDNKVTRLLQVPINGSPDRTISKMNMMTLDQATVKNYLTDKYNLVFQNADDPNDTHFVPKQLLNNLYSDRSFLNSTLYKLYNDTLSASLVYNNQILTKGSHKGSEETHIPINPHNGQPVVVSGDPNYNRLKFLNATSTLGGGMFLKDDIFCNVLNTQHRFFLFRRHTNEKDLFRGMHSADIVSWNTKLPTGDHNREYIADEWKFRRGAFELGVNEIGDDDFNGAGSFHGDNYLITFKYVPINEVVIVDYAAKLDQAKVLQTRLRSESGKSESGKTESGKTESGKTEKGGGGRKKRTRKKRRKSRKKRIKRRKKRKKRTRRRTKRRKSRRN